MTTETTERRHTVLVVDDTVETLGFLTATLDLAGFTVLVATDGESALKLLEQVTPDLILMDAVMPGIDGFETCARIKRDPRWAHVPVIFMTGLTDTGHVVKGLATGGVDYVTKPVMVDELLARIRVHLENARISQGGQAALDASGRFMLATDKSGALLWSTPRAQTLLARAFVAGNDSAVKFPPHVIEALQRLREASAGLQPRTVIESAGLSLEFSFLSQAGDSEYLFRVKEARAEGDEESRLQQVLNLTSREAEVLLWISRGKSNRDIGEILGISPRTVNKHLEQVFVKLGVENRASAAARAVRALAG